MECYIVYRRVQPLLDRKVTVLLVGWLVVINRKAVGKKRRKECIVCVYPVYPSY